MLTIHFANRYETLAGLLVARLGASGRSPFAADELIVPSAAVRRQLTLALADAHGVCAQVGFAYLARWLWQQIARVVPGVQSESPFEPAVLAWRIFGALGEGDGWVARHPRLRDYLASGDLQMRHELSVQLAGLFDQYITFRPDWLAAWSRGELPVLGLPAATATESDQAWQAELWRRLDTVDAASPAEAFIDALRQRGPSLVAQGVLPPVAHVFCLPSIPPLHLALLQALAGCIEVHVYALNPCREYWFEVVDRRRLAYLATRGQAAHHEEGNRLLAAWGRQAQSQLGLLVDASADGVVDDACFETPPGTAMLARLQRSILQLEDLSPGSIALAADDRSIEVHVCHSLAREVEVLHDRLLGLFAADPTLRPGDVLVVTPDLDAAAPLADAVFGTAPRERRIPHQVSGRSRSQANPAARALLDLLVLAGSRFAASEVFGLLQQPLVARRFGLDDDALARVHGWLRDAGVCWAIDAAQLAGQGLSTTARHTFADGLARLYLGYAMPVGDGRPFGGQLPSGDAEGSDALALGALSRFVDALATLRREVALPLPAADWPPRLAGWLHRFLQPADHELEDLQEVLASLASLADTLRRSALAETLPLAVVRTAVAGLLDDPARGGVPTGAVTMAAMSSLRSLPYRVVCAIGLDDGAFPTGGRPAEFDLMAVAAPRAGDRQRRNDERNLFLDLLLAAREVLHLSYVGRSVRDNAVLPPSVLVSELLEVLLPAVAGASRERFVVDHPLQAFAESAFRVDADPRQRSFRSEIAQALQRRGAALASAVMPADAAPQAAVAPAPSAIETDAAEAGDDAADDDAAPDDEAVAEPVAPFFAAPLAPPGVEWHDVPLARLLQFLHNPCRFLLRHRLGVVLPRMDEPLEDDEPFLFDVPRRSALAARLLPAMLDGADLDAARNLALAGTEVPAGAFGLDALERELASLQRFAQQAREVTAVPLLAPHAAALSLEVDGLELRLHGPMADLRAAGLVRARYDDLRATDVLEAWLHHLLLCADPPPGASLQTRWLARDQTLVLPAVDDVAEALRQLLGLYLRGLREPLYFFPKSAWQYMQAGRSASKAVATWRATRDRPFGEQADAAYRLALRGRPDPMSDGFADFDACAQAVFGPLLACRDGTP